MKALHFYFGILLISTCSNIFGTSIEASDTISSNTLWNADTVNITGNIVVKDYVTLTISPGTIVSFQGSYRIEIKGRLLAKGSKNNQIVFTQEDGSDTGWNGIIFNNISSINDSSILSYCTLIFCKSIAINVIDNSKLSVSNCIIIYNELGIRVKNSIVNICNNIINNNNITGIETGGVYGTINIINNQISGNAGTGISNVGYSDVLISHNIINNNGNDGIKIKFNHSPTTTINNVICKNGGTGISAIDSKVSVTNSTICYNIEGLDPGPESTIEVKNTILWNYSSLEVAATSHSCVAIVNYCIVEDTFAWRQDFHDGTIIYDNILPDEPKFKDATNDDYSLLEGSPCINAGNPNEIVNNDKDIIGNPRFFGGRIDIGAYEYINKPPLLKIPLNDYVFCADSAFKIDIPDSTFIDDNYSDSLIYHAKLLNNKTLPSWLFFDSLTRKFSGKASQEYLGIYTVIISVTDLYSWASDTFNIKIVKLNQPPLLYKPIPDQETLEGIVYSYSLPDSTFLDPDLNDSLSYKAFPTNSQELPSWITFDTVSLTFKGLPLHSDTGLLCLIIKATDKQKVFCLDTFCLSIKSTPTIINNGINSNCELTVYPNPTNSNININLKGQWQNNVNIKIYDINGRICYSINKKMTTNSDQINIKWLEKGYYIIEATNGLNKIHISLIVK